MYSCLIMSSGSKGITVFIWRRPYELVPPGWLPISVRTRHGWDIPDCYKNLPEILALTNFAEKAGENPIVVAKAEFASLDHLDAKYDRLSVAIGIYCDPLREDLKANKRIILTEDCDSYEPL